MTQFVSTPDNSSSFSVSLYLKKLWRYTGKWFRTQKMRLLRTGILKWVWWILKLKDGSTWQGDMTYIWSSTVQSAFQTNISTELFSPFYNNQSTIRLAFVGFRITHLKDGLIFSLRNVGKIHKKWFSQIKLNLLYTDNNNFETDADNNNWGHIYNISNSLFKFVQFFFVLPAISVLRTQNHIPAIQYAYSQEHMLLLWRLKWCILLHTSVISLFHDWFRILQISRIFAHIKTCCFAENSNYTLLLFFSSKN